MSLKKIINKYLLFIVICINLFFVGFNHVNARTCEYFFEGSTITLDITQDSTTNEIKVDKNIPAELGYDEEKSYNFIDGSFLDNDQQCLETITVCIHRDALNNSLGGQAMAEKYIALFGSSLDPSTIDDAIANEFDVLGQSTPEYWFRLFWTGDLTSCTTVQYSGSDKTEMKDNGNFVSYCDKFVSMYSDIATAYKTYGNCDGKGNKAEISRCRATAITDINTYTDRLKNTCNNILQNTNISVEDGCAASCVNANKALTALKKRYNLTTTNTNECSLSSRLVIWGSNIVKWVKYIVPVLVIILGILDFMKTIGADKADEMKKAQSRFVKRLIAAALIFIVPFIIEFVLGKMGFDSNGCGIIDL